MKLRLPLLLVSLMTASFISSAFSTQTVNLDSFDWKNTYPNFPDVNLSLNTTLTYNELIPVYYISWNSLDISNSAVFTFSGNGTIENNPATLSDTDIDGFPLIGLHAEGFDPNHQGTRIVSYIVESGITLKNFRILSQNGANLIYKETIAGKTTLSVRMDGLNNNKSILDL